MPVEPRIVGVKLDATAVDLDGVAVVTQVRRASP
jgi:hypothetical protein